MKTTWFILMMVALAVGTLHAAKADEPAFHTPEAAYNTIQKARQEGRYDIMLQGMSKQYKKDYRLTGINAASVLKKRMAEADKQYPEAAKLRKVESVDYSEGRKRATLHLDNEQYAFMVKEDGKWVSEYKAPITTTQKKEEVLQKINKLEKILEVTDSKEQLTEAERDQFRDGVNSLDEDK